MCQAANCFPTANIRTTEATRPAEETEGKSSNWASLTLLIIAKVGGIGGFLYAAFSKKKKQQEAAKPDPDVDYEDDAGYELPEDDGEEDSDDDSQSYSNDSDSESGMMEPDTEDCEPV